MKLYDIRTRFPEGRAEIAALEWIRFSDTSSASLLFINCLIRVWWFRLLKFLFFIDMQLLFLRISVVPRAINFILQVKIWETDGQQSEIHRAPSDAAVEKFRPYASNAALRATHRRHTLNL
ncbi:hypothetical protein EVAR_94284_1 [Eumeta japonica]|uniref:Uncharacterized protein n=1 Tax=Eumeta variegata TaxID=151549 RepID=A0A4C1UFR9_EUMVA|nr:hypothetical protein EVAR_94284_1 [Eumeta japonica]